MDRVDIPGHHEAADAALEAGEVWQGGGVSEAGGGGEVEVGQGGGHLASHWGTPVQGQGHVASVPGVSRYNVQLIQYILT